MLKEKRIDISIKVLTSAMLACALALTFSISDYYIFNRMSEYGVIFCICQWVKKAGLLLIALAVFYKNKSCSDIAKYVLPVFIYLSCIIFGGYFDITRAADTPQQEIYNQINLFMPKSVNMALFFTHAVLMLAVCVMLFVRDGYKANGKSFALFPMSMLLCMPLNVFENFFDITEIPQSSFWRFKTFSVWHFLAFGVMAGVTIGTYYFLRNKSARHKDVCLAAIATTLLIQYHSKDSMLLGDGYNVYYTVTAVAPLFICNIGVYIASAAVFSKNKTLYAISFFVHAAGAMSVFVYPGRNEISNFGLVCSYSILYYCATHIWLFVLAVMPTALGMYKFKWKDCIIPLAYYCGVIIAAAICSALVTSASMDWHTSNGIYLDAPIMPNYAFTQINPFPFVVSGVMNFTVWRYELNGLYLIGLYAAYVSMFFAFTGGYYAFLAARRRVLGRAQKAVAARE